MTSIAGKRAFNCAISSKPSISGIRMSTIASSGWKSSASDSASRDERVPNDLVLLAEDALDSAQHARLIIHDEDRAGLMTAVRCGCRHRLRNEHADVGAVSRLALNRERAVDLPENRAADRQAEAVAVRLGREERLEHPRQILGRDAAAGIGNRDFDETIDGADA